VGFKARYLLHTVKRNGGNAAAALTAANAALESNADNATFPYEESQTANNPLAAFGQERPNTLGFHPNVQNIVEEAYKAYYGFNFLQTWTNYRRTGFPNLNPSANASPSFSPSGVIPQRWLYVNSETQTNAESVTAATEAQGGALLDNKLWAFQ